MLSGIDSPHELSEVLEQNLIKEMVPLSKRESLQKRIENQLTPAEPDPDEPMAENSKQLLESQLLSEVDPGNLIQIIQKMERKRWSDNLRNFLINATTKDDDQTKKVS